VQSTTDPEALVHPQRQEFHPNRRRRRWLGWTLVVTIPLIVFALFFFHVVVSAGAAGGCGGG
jgi:hypothetical protein